MDQIERTHTRIGPAVERRREGPSAEEAKGPGDAGSTPSLRRVLKRAFDVTLAACGLVAASPLIAIIAVAIRLSMGSPVLFHHVRPGFEGKPFKLVKLRTMRDATGPNGEPIPGRDRVTRLGSLLRRTSLDELPELWNVLRGDMSLVGPRPLLMEFLDYYTPEQARRHDVKPGMTGWAQINGRRNVQMQERIAMDVWYVDNWSLRLDATIALATIGQIVRGKDAEPTVAVATSDLGWARDARKSNGEQVLEGWE